MSSKKKRKSPWSFASSKKPSKSKAFEFIRYIVRAGRELKTKAKTNLQTRTHKSHGRTIVAGNRLQENLVNRQSLARKSREISFLPVLSRGCDFVGECFRKLRAWFILDRVLWKQALPSRNSSENLLTNLVAGERETFRQEQHLSPLCN